ncbi:MAG: type II toxin-antitoxin system HipA family toxin [Rhodospirillaceae bacterium]|nr:type II toxin-antitoxin system HipA family toxin [Rhodospirillaceae bacterium]MBT3885674.1 type II toxin-antitoxin system HipA family toxin [Rhodospirillaceae bacterium]MBT4118527.1 type II toxin-antitoxin system HipA family toxin [Rhodospirillaceae bacterium]MBT4671924.1 type II toxin-antitoxin system HipA family toxin [Rhodospirillaceae bacterium]MBT4720762.1 type II toxin-antitoxin system HipA family toxin [Rhodospirillaceae bacterium]
MKIGPGTPLDVTLNWGADDVQSVGRLAYRDRVAYLQYDDAFLNSGIEISPVYHRTSAGLHQPLRADVFEGLHGVFHDSLPDGWGRLLVDRRAAQLGIEAASLTPLDRLACVGASGIGALSYAPAIDPWDMSSPELDLGELAAGARQLLGGTVGEVLSALGRAGGSPGGARPKALLALGIDGQAMVGAGAAPAEYNHYLVKFPGSGDPEDIAAIEMAYSQMAKEAGVEMAETRLLEDSQGGLYFAARRFDRQGDDRVHVHSACGLLYSDIRLPALDYKDLILLARNVTHDQRQCKAMFTLAVFNVLAHNRDDHARQFSFTMERSGAWHMAPAYDLTYSAGPAGEHSTAVLGYGGNITHAHLLQLGTIADLNEAEAGQIIERAEAALGQWKTIAGDYGVARQSKGRIGAALASVRL